MDHALATEETNIEELIEFFISRSPEFHNDLNEENIDEKHALILEEASKQFRGDGHIDLKTIRNWASQSDLGAPAQISRELIRANGFADTVLRYAYLRLIRRRLDDDLRSTIQDDLAVIRQIGGRDLLLENPVHETPGATMFYREDGTTFNQRWLRYIYLLKRILDTNVLKEDGTWVDVGSYYGGLQGLVRKYLPHIKIILVDFHHQLCRSFVYLSGLYPDAAHVFPDQLVAGLDLDSFSPGSIVYVPAKDFHKISQSRARLVSNFFSLGEMRREYFSVYVGSPLFRNSELLYLVNRFVGAPFFDRTYDTDTNVLDYLIPGRTMLRFDVFPIHHYQIVYREALGREYWRNMSSSYFEMLSTVAGR